MNAAILILLNVALNAPPADLVVENANIWTGDENHPRATTLVIDDGRFVAVDPTPAQLESWIGEETSRIDAQGRLLLPGLIDTHVHLAGAAADMRYLDLRHTASRADLLQKLGRYARTFDRDAWVVGTRWSAESWPDQRPPSADEIDEATDGRKTVLIRMDGHSLLASRSALEYAGIDADGPDDPPGGTIGRNEQGIPTGQIYEQAQPLVMKHVQLPEADTLVLLKKAIAEVNRNGLTQVGSIEGVETFRNLIGLDQQGELPLRISGTIRGGGDSVKTWTPIMQWIEANRSPSPNIELLGVKGFMDGTLGSRTAWMTEPYEDNHLAPDKAADNVGFPLAMAATGALSDLITDAAQRRLQPAVHAIGDRSNHVVLDWYASLDESTRRRIRPRVEHAQHLLPEDVARFATLGIIPSMQPYHKRDDGRYAEQRLGPERIRTSYAFRDLLDTGAKLAFGSDWPVVTVNPFAGIEAAVTARTLDGEVFVPEQSISVKEALVCYTRNAAYCLHSEDITGMIQKGFEANFILVDQDLFAIDPDDIDETRVLLTVVRGKRVYAGNDRAAATGVTIQEEK